MNLVRRGQFSPLFCYVKFGKLEEEIRQIIEERLEGNDHFLVALNLGGSDKRVKLSIFIDGDNGVSIDKCAEISRFISEKIDAVELISNAYVIEVSSAGVDKPLINSRQYTKNIGRQVDVIFSDGSKKRGKLIKVNPSSFEIEQSKKKRKEIDFKDVKSTKVIISF